MPQLWQNVPDDPSETVVVIGEGKAGFAVIVLLFNHAIQPHVAPLAMGQRVACDRQPVAVAAKLGAHDVKAQKRKTVIVIHRRDRRDHVPVQKATQKSGWIGHAETGRILCAGVPPLAAGPIDGML